MVSTTGMVVSLKTDLRFPESGQQGHGAQIIQKANGGNFIMCSNGCSQPGSMWKFE